MKATQALPLPTLLAPAAGLLILAGSLLGLGGWYAILLAAGLFASVEITPLVQMTPPHTRDLLESELKKCE